MTADSASPHSSSFKIPSPELLVRQPKTALNCSLTVPGSSSVHSYISWSIKSAGAAKKQPYLDWGPLHKGMFEGRFFGLSKTRRRERNSGNSFSSEPDIFVGCVQVGTLV